MYFGRSSIRLIACVLAISALAGLRAPAAAQDVVVASRRAAASLVRPGDRIDLQFQLDKDLNASVTVNERGQAVFPKLGTLDVAEVMIAGLRDTLRTRYSWFL